MKKWILLSMSLLLAVFLTACADNNDANDNSSSDDMNNNGEQSDDTINDNDQNTDNGNMNDNNTQDNENMDENNDNTDHTADNAANSDDNMQEKMDKLDYEEIEVEVDYGKNNEYEAEIEQDEGEPIESELEDEVNDEFLNGEEAFNKLYPMVKELSIDKDTGKDEAIQDILSTFDLDDDYDEFELEITFNDGEELEYEDK